MPIDSRLPDGLFKDGPPLQMHRLFGLVGRINPKLKRRAGAVALAGWLPVLLLLVLGVAMRWTTRADSFIVDYAFHARSLVAAPILILAEAVSAARLGGIVRHFVEAGLVPASERPRFDAAIASTLRLRDSRLVEVAVAVLAYVLTFLLFRATPIAPRWWLREDGPLPFLSPAGWWHVLVSFPLVLSLVLGWIWRVILWTRFLWRVSKLRLRLVPAHPDLTAGLRFVGYSVRAFSPVALAFGFIVAGSVANAIVNRGEALEAYRHVPLVLAAFVVLLFGAPLFVFGGTLMETWRRGVFQYGAIAGELGREFEHRWFEERRVDPSALGVQDFSATVDLYQFVANVYQMKLVPFDAKSLLLLVIAAVVPFVPIVLVVLPVDVVLQKLAGLWL